MSSVSKAFKCFREKDRLENFPEAIFFLSKKKKLQRRDMQNR